jgi:hypothetical protein
MKTWLLPGLVLGLALAAPLFTVACTGGSDDDSNPTTDEDNEIKKKKAGAEGASCSETKQCAAGLLCKVKSSGPPPGAMGLPAQGSGSNGPPPGAMGMPAPPEKTCQKPAPGEEGGYCSSSSPCQAGLHCVIENNGGGANFPPGAMGMPMQPHGTCKHNGPPPGAVGLPMQPNQ